MASLKEIRTRISSVKSTRQVTSAMKMVSAAKLRRAQDAITQMRPYAEKLHGILTNLSASLNDADDNKYARKRDVKRVLMVVVSSNRGLCGAFNANVVKKTIDVIQQQYKHLHAAGQVDIITFGKKSADLFGSRGLKVRNSYPEIYDELSFDNVSKYSTEIMQQFLEGKYDRVELVYNAFKNAGSQDLTHESFLPVEVETGKESFKADYIFEPSKEYIVAELIPLSLKTQFYKAMLDSHAAEHGARMTSMHQATDNATELLKELQLHYNKARQASITNEILEIVSGAEALKG